MSAERTMRLGQVSRKLNVGKDTIIGYLENKGFEVESSPNAKITSEQYKLLAKEFASSLLEKEEAEGLTIGTKHTENVVIEKFEQGDKRNEEEDQILITNLQLGQEEAQPEPDSRTATDTVEVTEDKKKEDKEEKKEKEDTGKTIEVEKPKLKGIKVLGKIDLSAKPKKEETKPNEEETSEVAGKKEELESKEKELVSESVATEADVPKEEVKDLPKTEVKPVPETEAEPEPVPAPPDDELEKVDEPPVEETATEEPIETPDGKESDEPSPKKASGLIEAKAAKLKGLKVVGKIDLPAAPAKKKEKPVASSDESLDRKRKKRPRKRIATAPSPRGATTRPSAGAGRADQRQRPRRKDKPVKEELTDKEIQEKIKATLAKLSGGTGKKSTGAKYRREKRASQAEAREEAILQEQEDAKILQVNEFISANDLANLIGVSVNDIISTCMSMGMFVSINQRLDAEAITLISDEFGYDVEFISSEEKADVEVKEDTAEELLDRAPIVTIMGHVDHGKTSLLDYIRKTEVTASEAGGITQHIGAYDVTTKSGQKIAFLDTPGHEAFTAMRARGAKVTDVVVIVIAADDNVMPQTKEAINHSQVAGVPMVIAINKMDRPNANPEKIKEELANLNILVEDWGGKYQCQEISAKTGEGIEELLEKVLLEAELLELKANPNKGALGTVIEASLDKGRGYVSTLLVQAGSMKVGDVILAGSHFGKVKAMFDHTGQKLASAGPSTPLQLLGLNGAPQAGDKFNILGSEREAREIATKREQLKREQDVRTKKHITLDEIGRRLAIGSFKELNIIVKADVDGSIEALSDSLLKLSTEEVQVNIISKAVGQISESDVLLATAADGIIIGFQVRPSAGARKLAEQEQIEIRLYSIIYDAINEVKDAMEGMLAPDIEEVIVGNVQVRDVFKITRIGTVAGCMVIDGQIKRNNQVRLVRDGIVVYTGKIAQLKRFKEDVNEVKTGYECGVSIENFNDIKVGDVIESFEERETKRKL